MGRPLGSVNKPKKVKQSGPQEVVKQVVVPEIVQSPIKDEAEGALIICKEFICAHPKSMHYGPKTDWCNKQNCPCQSFR